MFGQKKNSPISESLSKTRPVRYNTEEPKGNFKRARHAVPESNSFGHKGKPALEPLEATEDEIVTTEPREEIPNLPEEYDKEHTAISEDVMEPQEPEPEVMNYELTDIKDRVLPRILDLIDPEAASQLTRHELGDEFEPITSEVLRDLKINLNRQEQRQLEASLIDEILGHGPLEKLLKDNTISDIMVNGPDQVYIERNGKLELTDVRFRDDEHVMNVANRIVNRIGRRIDQTSPLCDARLEDGSRVNVVVPPLAIKGPTISIRKFSAKPLSLNRMVHQNNLSKPMSVFLKAAAASRLNIIVSGGTGSGKTTLLNALSKLIDQGERIVTIEDAAELRLQQPHVIPLETRPQNLEGQGEVTIRDLTINALRMRPDRIILGEVRGPECLDMLQAMNTGHEGSMCTLHANRPREALTRMENMAIMSGINYPLSAIRSQIVEAIDVIVQVARMRDGMRRVISITEVVGMEGDVVVTQELFRYKYHSDDARGMMQGVYEYQGLRPACHEKLREYGFEKVVMEALK